MLFGIFFWLLFFAIKGMYLLNLKKKLKFPGFFENENFADLTLPNLVIFRNRTSKINLIGSNVPVF